MAVSEDLIAEVIWFLKETLRREELSADANRQRLALLQRLAKPEGYTNCSYPYVDMSGYKDDGNKSRSATSESLAECYEELESAWCWSTSTTTMAMATTTGSGKSCTLPAYRNSAISLLGDACAFSSDCNSSSSPPSSTKSTDESEILTISAAAIRYSAVKFGPLARKEKIIFVDSWKKCWAALLGTTLYLYYTDRDAKPYSSVDVDEYKARMVSSVKKEIGFEIVCPGRKTYQFYTNSKSEVETWIACINHSMALPQTSCVMSGISTESVSSSSSSNRNSIPDRELPAIPDRIIKANENVSEYDRPNPVIRPVSQPRKCDVIEAFQERFYHSIEESLAEQLARYDYPVRQTSSSNEYYNILVQERICEDIPKREQKETDSVLELQKTKLELDVKMGTAKTPNRIQQIIRKIEEINSHSCGKKGGTDKEGGKGNPVEELYELVNCA